MAKWRYIWKDSKGNIKKTTRPPANKEIFSVYVCDTIWEKDTLSLEKYLAEARAFKEAIRGIGQQAMGGAM